MTVRSYMKRVKENDGRAARNATLKVVLWFVAAQALCVVLFLLFRQQENVYSISEKRIRSNVSSSSAAGLQAVLEARYFLTSLSIPRNALAASDHKHPSYHGVTATFCPLDWHLQKQNPSTVAMFRDLVAASSHCQAHAVELSLEHVVKQVRHYDEHVTNAPHSLEIAGLVFHETRCGSTLTANLLSAADPPAHRVYSEAGPLLSAVLAPCPKGGCDQQKHDDLIRDTLYIMGRSSDVREKRVFYKIQSVGVRDIDTLASVIPDTPWLFIYRNSVEVIMSHFKDASITNNAVCLRGRNMPHALVEEIAASQGRTAKSLSKAEYCAAHLASLCESAIRHGQRTDSGRFVNYADLPDVLWESVLPDYFHISNVHYKEMKKAADVYSKGRGVKANKAWQEDSTRKQDGVSTEIKEAAEAFLEPSFEKLEEMAHEAQ